MEEGYLAGNSITSFPGWSSTSPDVAEIKLSPSISGHQYLNVASEDDQVLEFAVPSGNPFEANVLAASVLFIDVMVRPGTDRSATASVSLDANGSALAFLPASGDGGVVPIVETPSGEQAVDSPVATFPIGESGMSSKWLRVTIRQDLAARTWDLFVDGRLVAVDLPMHERPTGGVTFRAYSAPDRAFDLDALGVSTDSPLFADTDQDGLPDFYEQAHGLDPNFNDRGLDLDGDGVSNVGEFLRRTDPSQAPGNRRRTIFVDNRIGNDSSSGELPYASGSNGPLASITAATRFSDRYKYVVVLPGTGTYLEDGLDLTGKNLDLLNLGNIIIQ